MYHPGVPPAPRESVFEARQRIGKHRARDLVRGCEMRGWTKVALGALTAIATLGLAPAASATTYYCHALPATIVGTAGSNSIGSWCSPGPDVIVTLGGDDYVNAGDGDDTVCSGTGNDRVSGQIGADTILTGSGNDTVNGGPDYDTMWLGGGADANLEAGGLEGHTIYGGPGDD